MFLFFLRFFPSFFPFRALFVLFIRLFLPVIYSLTVIETETETQIISLTEMKRETEMFSKTETKYKRKSERAKLHSNWNENNLNTKMIRPTYNVKSRHFSWEWPDTGNNLASSLTATPSNPASTPSTETIQVSVGVGKTSAVWISRQPKSH